MPIDFDAMILNDAPGGIVVIDVIECILFSKNDVTHSTEKLFGYEAAELRGQLIEVLLPQRLRGGHIAHRSGFFTKPRSGAEACGRGRGRWRPS
jgi:protein-histidine pros-kinase